MITGEYHPLELHLAHQDDDGKTVVIGVLYDAGRGRAAGGGGGGWPRKVGGLDELRKPFDPSGRLPETRRVFRHASSRTAPPCTEGEEGCET